MRLGFGFGKYCSDIGTWLDSWQRCRSKVIGILHLFAVVSKEEIKDYEKAFLVFGS